MQVKIHRFQQKLQIYAGAAPTNTKWAAQKWREQ